MKKSLFNLLLLLNFIQIVQAQKLTPELALAKFSKYPQERIFIVLDKDDYLAGDQINLKAYVFSKQVLSGISTNLYIEFLDQTKKAVSGEILPIINGTSTGALHIPDNLPENIYFIRAYTSWMLNFDDRFQFIVPLNVYNPRSSTELIEQPINWSFSVHPEGGQLLDNVPCNMAIRLHCIGRLPKGWTGSLYEKADSLSPIAPVTCYNEEIGSIKFMPQYGKHYYLKLTDAVRNSKAIDLPEVKQQGKSLQVISSPGSITYRISSKGMDEGLKGFRVIAHIGGEVIYSARIKNNVEEINGTIPLDSLTKGLMHIMLLDTSENLISERLCLANTALCRPVQPVVQSTGTGSEGKKLNEWNIHTDMFAASTCAVKIVNDLPLEVAHFRDFLCVFWLGDLAELPCKGDWYFNKENPLSEEALDYVLMSEKWQRFKWEQLSVNILPKLISMPDDFLCYEGEILRNRKPLKNKEVIIKFQLTDSSNIVRKINTDNLGKFIMKNIAFYDSAKVYLRINNEPELDKELALKLVRLSKERPYTGVLPVSGYAPKERSSNDTTPDRIVRYIKNQKALTEIDNQYKVLDTATVKRKNETPKAKLNKKLSTPMFRGANEIVFDFINENQDAGGSNLLEYLSSRVAGFSYNGDTPVMRGATVKIYIDEWQSDQQQLNSIPLSEIAMVKVLRSPYMLGSSTPVLAIYTKRARSQETQNKQMPATIIAGYPVQSLEKPFLPGSHLLQPRNDKHNILFPDAEPETVNGEKIIRFLNNDSSESRKLIIIGISKNNIPIYLCKNMP